MSDIIVSVFRLAILLLSFYGYILLVRDRLKLHTKFCWIFVFSCIGCVMYFAGLIGVLNYTAYAVFALGLILFIFFVVRKKYDPLQRVKAINTLNIVFIVAFGVVFASLISTHFIHYDNFSHWGLIVKYLLINNAFPDAAAALIDFKTYPLGISAFLYYVCKIAGSGQGVMLVGQIMLLFACFYAMFGVIRDTKRVLLISLMGLICALMTFFNISIRVNNLLVDFLLPLMTLAATAAIFAYRSNIKMACVIAAPILALLVVIKNSGLFFAVICFVYLLYVALRCRKYRTGAKRSTALLLSVAAILFSLIPFVLWNAHTAQAFKGENTKHTMNLDNFSAVSSEKTPEIVETIINNYVHAIFSTDSLASMGLVLFNALALAAWLTARLAFRKKWQLLKVLVAVDIAVIIYYLGILAMFIFSMPTEEALHLAGFERYASSIIVFMIGALALCAVYDTENSLYIQQGEKRDYMAFKSLATKNVYQTATTACIALAAFILLSEINGMDSMKNAYSESLPARVERLTGDKWTGLDNHKYLCYASDTDQQISDYYLQYTARYFLFAPHVDAVSSISELREKLPHYDYLIVVESDDALRSFLGEQVTEGVYNTQELPTPK